MSWAISASVGRWEKKAVNRKADVETVQTLLTLIAAARQNPAFDPRGIDGVISRPPSRSNTIKAIEAFQSLYMIQPDGLIGVGGRTFRELVAAAGPPTAAAPLDTTARFPFQKLPNADWTSSPRRFGANRKGKSGPRAHAGCDLYFPQGTPIHAVADGVVTRAPYDFYAQTDALEVDHGGFLVRYCEIKKGCRLRLGERVQGGQPIAQVGHLVGISVPSDMLHLELYDKSAQGNLTVGSTVSKRHTNGRVFFRRLDLIDPTPFLNQWQANLAP